MENILIKPSSNDYGLNHALKIREDLLKKSRYIRVSIEAQCEPFYFVRLYVYIYNGLYTEHPISIYHFNSDGTYNVLHHT